MAFETFNPASARRRTGSEKRVTLSKTGQIALNTVSVRAHFAESENVVLLYDRETRSIAIKPAGADDENACKLSTAKSGSAYLSGRGFLAFFEVPYEQTTAYPAEWNETLAALVIQLDNKQAKTRKPRKSA